jgi:hypothetical protein
MAYEATSEVSEKVGSLRGRALELLQEMTRRGLSRDAQLSAAVVGMQRVANELGTVERILDLALPAPSVEAPRALNGRAPATSQDAAIVLGLAGTAVPFAASLEEEAERWLRVLRLHGHVGAAMQALGIPEAPLETPAQPKHARLDKKRTGEDTVRVVAERAARLARNRGADRVSTLELLFAVVEVYGRAFDRALYERGSSRDELLGHLAGVAHARSA